MEIKMQSTSETKDAEQRNKNAKIAPNFKNALEVFLLRTIEVSALDLNSSWKFSQNSLFG